MNFILYDFLLVINDLDNLELNLIKLFLHIHYIHVYKKCNSGCIELVLILQV